LTCQASGRSPVSINDSTAETESGSNITQTQKALQTNYPLTLISIFFLTLKTS
jgi:hypothetical protein